MTCASSAWTPGATVQSISNTQSGPSLAWDATLGFGIAVVERSQSALTYTSSTEGTTWTSPDPVFQSGTGGWYPSLAVDPVNHEPAIAFSVCSPRAGQSEGSCQPAEDELRVAQRIGDTWRQTLVDPEGGFLPRLGFLSTGKRVVAYRHPTTGILTLAVER